MPHAYTEDQLVEQPAIGLFAELGWQTVVAMEEVFGRSRGDETHSIPAESQRLLTSSPTINLGRETSGEVVLVSRDNVPCAPKTSSIADTVVQPSSANNPMAGCSTSWSSV